MLPRQNNHGLLWNFNIILVFLEIKHYFCINIIIERDMRHCITIALLLYGVLAGLAQTSFHYKGRAMTTSSRCLLVDRRHDNPDAFTFSSVGEALRFAERQGGKDTLWTDIYIAPSVYWIDNPDDEVVRKPLPGFTIPFGMTVNASRIRLRGLGGTAEEVVLACNRGQTQGAEGNFTMFHFTGSHIEAEGITFGNYCNVDLIYNKDPKQNRRRRKEAIVQAQIAICSGDNYRLKDCRFISRLNLCPFVGAEHTEFEDCYFECTDDALCGTGVYRRCRFTLFSSKPFYTTDKRKGAVFEDCQLHSKTQGTQYLTKVSGPVRMRNCQWTSDDPKLRIEWCKRPDPKHLCTMEGCTLNGKPLHVATPTEPLNVELPPMAAQIQTDIIPGGWTLDCHKPLDTMAYDWEADNSRGAWGYGEGVDGAEGSWGMVQLQKGARMMFTPRNEKEAVTKQTCRVSLDPCKSGGQGFGSATGQYLDICIKFDTRTLTGYGIRFMRTPDYDHAVETFLVEYSGGVITTISPPERCDIFKRGCTVTLTAEGQNLTATIENSNITEARQTLTTTMPHPNTFGGFHLQHTGSTGASATVVKSVFLK